MQDAISHARLPATPVDEGRLKGMLVAARETVENLTGRALITQEWELSLDAMPCGRWIQLPKPRLQQVLEFTTFDRADQPTVHALSDYIEDAAHVFGRLALKYNRTWPTALRDVRAVVIKFRSGYGDDPEDVPQTLRDAVLMLAAHWYDLGRVPAIAGTIVSEIPMTVRLLLEAGDNTVRRGFA